MATFIHPCPIMIVGGSSSGKSVLTRKIIANNKHTFSNLRPNPKVLWIYGVTSKRDVIPNTESVLYHEGMVSVEQLETTKADIIVVDDLCNELSNDKTLQNMFTKYSHHYGFTVIYITQSMFLKGQCIITRNTHYIILMRSPGDKRQIDVLAGQLFPRRKQLLEHFHESYDDATKRMFGYLVVDISPTSEEVQKLSTNVLPEDDGKVRRVFYVPE